LQWRRTFLTNSSTPESGSAGALRPRRVEELLDVGDGREAPGLFFWCGFEPKATVKTLIPMMREFTLAWMLVITATGFPLIIWWLMA
jgi:hypothetical protein